MTQSLVYPFVDISVCVCVDLVMFFSKWWWRRSST